MSYTPIELIPLRSNSCLIASRTDNKNRRSHGNRRDRVTGRYATLRNMTRSNNNLIFRLMETENKTTEQQPAADRQKHVALRPTYISRLIKVIETQVVGVHKQAWSDQVITISITCRSVECYYSIVKWSPYKNHKYSRYKNMTRYRGHTRYGKVRLSLLPRERNCTDLNKSASECISYKMLQ